MLIHFAEDCCERDWAVVFSMVSVPFLVNGGHICIAPILWCGASVIQLLEKYGKGRSELICYISKDSRWDAVWSCCLVRLQPVEELHYSRCSEVDVVT